LRDATRRAKRCACSSATPHCPSRRLVASRRRFGRLVELACSGARSSPLAAHAAIAAPTRRGCASRHPVGALREATTSATPSRR
jgi:hypothetical protein